MSYDTLSLSTLASRLVAARKAADVTQQAAAEHLGFSRPTFIAIEKAVRRPKPAELVKLAELYRQPLSKLLREDAAPEAMRPDLRSVLDTATRDAPGLEDAINRLASFIDDYQFIEKISGARIVPDFPPEVRVPPGPIEKFAEHCAVEQRMRLGIGELQPIDFLRKSLEDSGLHVFLDDIDSELAGLYVFVPKFGYCILVNRRHPRERRRWTIAHAYAHFLIDRHKPGVDYVRPFQRKPEAERFADAFAAALLMPEAGVTGRFYDHVNRMGDFTVSDLFHMASHFKVSPMIMSLRLEGLGLVPRSSWDRVQESAVPMNVPNGEASVARAHDNESVPQYPERYKLLAVRAFEEGKLSEGQLASLLRCSRVEARQIVEDCSQTWGESDPGKSVNLGRSLLTTASG